MNTNQKIVLDWLKKQGAWHPVFSIHELHDNFKYTWSDAYEELTHEEEYEVIKAFAEWGLRDGCK